MDNDKDQYINNKNIGLVLIILTIHFDIQLG